MSVNTQELEYSECGVRYILPKPYGLIADFNDIKYRNKVCMYPGCDEPAINSHVLSQASIRKYANNQITSG